MFVIIYIYNIIKYHIYMFLVKSYFLALTYISK